MAIAVLYPMFDHPAIEERYASWQTQMLLRGADDAVQFVFYDAEEPASYAVSNVESEHVLVITDPLLIPSARLGARLRHVLLGSDAVAAVPVANESDNARQKRVAPATYLTLRELQMMTEEMQRQQVALETVKWDKADPGAYVCRTDFLDAIDDVPRRVLSGREVVISPADYVHRWSSFRGQTRYDLLTRISTDAKNILEFGCGEAPLGEALKRRQPCRVVGIELDPRAATVARKRIDDVYCADVREVVSLMQEKFDWIIGGDIVEHIDEPWSFLSDLRRIAAPGGRLLLSLPNVANASVIADLLHGRFDYVYMGLTCVGHLRFFTKRTIEEMLTIAGWSVVEIAPQPVVATRNSDELLNALNGTRYAYSKDDVTPTGYYVIAENRTPGAPASHR